MSDTLALHIVATRLPDQLLTTIVSGDEVPPADETDAAFARTLPDGTPIAITVSYQPATPPPNAIERATLAEVVARMDMAFLVPATPSELSPSSETNIAPSTVDTAGGVVSAPNIAIVGERGSEIATMLESPGDE